MSVNVTFFETESELSALTGLTHKQLWDEGFNLDDWDWGFVSPTKWKNHWDAPGYMPFILDHMDNYCCGYEEVHYGNMWYYMLYHA